MSSNAVVPRPCRLSRPAPSLLCRFLIFVRKIMVDVTAEWALAIVTVGLVGATIVLAYFTSRLVRESRALSEATKALVVQASRQVEVHKRQIWEDAQARGRGAVVGDLDKM